MNNKKKTFFRAAIMVGLMFAVLPMAIPSIAASPGVVILDDNVENVTWSDEYWTNTSLWHITTPAGCNCTDNNSWYYGQEVDCDYDTGATNSGTLTSKPIDLTDAFGATLTFWTYWVTENTGTLWDIKKVQVSTDGGANWTTVKQLNGTENDKTISVYLSGYANKTIQIRFYFDTEDHLYNNYYGWCIDDIKVVKEVVQMPGIEVNKTVLDPKSGEWVKNIDANISDILRFKCTIHNEGVYNLSHIIFWDILDCSLEYAGNATLDGEPIDLDDDEFIFKPKTLVPENLSWDPYAPYEDFFELCPEEGNHYELWDWLDTDGNGRLSECDQIVMGEFLQEEFYLFHVDKVPYLLGVINMDTEEEMLIDSELDYEEINLSDPVCTQWNEVCCCKDSYHLQDWSDEDGSGDLSEDDIIELRNKRTGEVAEYFVEGYTIDLVVSREWWIEDLIGEYIELEPCQTITIEFDARVVKCGVDNNTQFAKGWCDDTEEWVYDNDTVTINVPPKPGIEVNKTVWNETTDAWVDEITANISDTVIFNSTIHNNGTCCNLTNITVMDTMSDSLEYFDAHPVLPDAVISNPEGTTTLVWNISISGIQIPPGETMWFLIAANVTKCGLEPDWNKQNATAEACGETVYDEDYAYVNVPPKPAIEVNKTVWDPEEGEWVEKIHDAKICENYTFRCEIHNNGTCCNLTDIRFWDNLSCSMEYANNASLKTPDGEWMDIVLPGDFTFKPRILHPLTPGWNPYEPICNVFEELCPEPGKVYHLSSWHDTNGDGKLSHCDQIDMEDMETGNVSWYHVELLPYTLTLTNVETGITYFDSELDYQEIDLSEPVYTQWKEVCCCKDSYHLVEWVDTGEPFSELSPSDFILLQNKRTEEIAEYHVEEVTIDLVVSKEWLIDDWLPGLVLEPCQNVTIEFDAHVVDYGEDCNVQNAKAFCAEADKWVSDEDMACINVPPGEPDLNITDKFETWLNITHYNITYTVKNIGGANTTNVSRTNITIDVSQVENDTVKVLNASETHTATFGPYEMSDDTDTIRICADIDGNVTESNEDNNCLSNTLRKSNTIKVNETGWWVKPVEGDSAEGEFHSTNTPIQHAIDNATDGCTILVHDGTYNENIDVYRELTIKAASSPINDGQGMFGPAVHITADNVTFQGFIIRNFTANTTYGIGAILVEGNGSTIEDNVIEHIYNATADPAGIGIDVHAYDVQVINNTVHNTGSIGIRVRDHWKEESMEPPSMSNNVSVENNTVYWTNNTGVLVTGFAKGVTIKDNEIYESLEPTPYNLFVHCGASDVVIEDNNIHDTYSNIVLGGCDNITISGNTITSATNATVGSSYGKNIYILNDHLSCSGDVNLLSTNVTIMNNDILDGNYGVRIWNISAADATLMATTTTINYNNIVNNTVYGVENANILATVNATHNWWNDTCGPGLVGPGSGDNVSANVTYSPWLDAPHPVGVPVESCARVYFEPENSSALYCNTTDVEIWVNATGDFQSGQINLTYNQTCANVTDWTLNTTNFGFGWWTHKNGSDRISFAGDTTNTTGKYMIGTLTIHCVNSSDEGCNTTLYFDNGSELFDDLGETLPVEWINGMFSCEGALCGDANCNGGVDTGDATLILNHWTDPGKYPLCNNWAGDVNCDYTINVGDATLILNHWLNLSAYPLNCCTV